MDRHSGPLRFSHSIYSDEDVRETSQRKGAQSSLSVPQLDLQTMVPSDPTSIQETKGSIRLDNRLLRRDQVSLNQAPPTYVDGSPGRLLTYPLLSDRVLGIVNSSLRRRTRLLKGISVCRPFTPRYISTWDVDLLLNYLNSLDNDQVDLRWMAIKLASLLVLALAARGSDLTQLNIVEPWLSRTPGGFHVILKGRQKTSHIFPGPVELDLVQGSAEPSLCLVNLLNSYLNLSAPVRQDFTQLLITSRKPFRPAKVNTIRGCILSAMSAAGIDVTVFKGHSIKGASASKAAARGLPLPIILEAARWSSSKTFVNV
ncbi:Tyrosine recombinase [Pelobates cultripes]|uniref:Tyrosine recombinase n=1 Tax=Pelobates cultripes TaxID=61616 RepID=A0AAD1W1U3_PELCU|nr:Tyrosine recombinase [Pelobates cultripes]